MGSPRVISIINLKGGVAKTISSVNMAHILASVHGYKVLLIDNDKQGNAGKILNRHSASRSGAGVKGTAEIMTDRGICPEEVIQHTEYERLDIVAADMRLLSANLQVLLDQTSPQQTRFRRFIKALKDDYDFVIVDNAPDINISTINALVASDDVLIPITIDEFAIDGLAELNEQIRNTKEDLNPVLELRGCFITQYDRYNEADVLGEKFLQGLPYPVFDTHIRRTPKMKLSTFAHKPIVDFSPRCGASIDYMQFVCEYLEMVHMPLVAVGMKMQVPLEHSEVNSAELHSDEWEDNDSVDWYKESYSKESYPKEFYSKERQEEAEKVLEEISVPIDESTLGLKPMQSMNMVKDFCTKQVSDNSEIDKLGTEKKDENQTAVRLPYEGHMEAERTLKDGVTEKVPKKEKVPAWKQFFG